MAKDDPADTIDLDAEPAAPTGVPADAWDLLSPVLTEARRAKIAAVAGGRTGRIRLVVQDIHDPHNVSACLRSADAFGVQHCDVVTLRERFRASTVSRGVAAWLTVERHQSVEACVARLRQDGFRIYAGLPLPHALPLGEVPVTGKVAVVFGNEHAGIDKSWLQHVDQPFTIPMVGMVESLNISVSAAITLQYLTAKARLMDPEGYHLNAAERQALLNQWACRQFNAWPEMVARLRVLSKFGS